MHKLVICEVRTLSRPTTKSTDERHIPVLKRETGVPAAHSVSGLVGPDEMITFFQTVHIKAKIPRISGAKKKYLVS